MSGGRRRSRVLLVEDDVSIRDMVSKHLRRQRFEVDPKESAEQVLAEEGSGELDYDLALVDVHLPGRSGVDLTRLLLSARPLSPVLVITGDDDAELAREALSVGAAGYLLKPFQLFELDAALSQATAMLDLVETTETLARSQARGLEEWGEAGGQLPRSWLHVGDERSGADAGHGARVVSMAGLLAKKVGDVLDATDREHLRTAARTHEIGRLTGGGSRAQVAGRSAQLLRDLGFAEAVCDLVREAAEPWEPGRSMPARILDLTDRLDHDAVARLAVEDPEDAIRRAIDAVIASAGTGHDPGLARLLGEQREPVESMWVLQRRASVPR